MRWTVLLSLLPLALAAPTTSPASSGVADSPSATSTATASGSTSASTGNSTSSSNSTSNANAHPSVKIYPNSSNGNGVEITGTNNPKSKQDVYLGVPYAAPPVGDLRFAPPQDFSYNFSVTAQRPPPACLQNANTTGTTKSEDCLYLNIYTPEGVNGETAWLPVFVWVHGGAFTSGDATFFDGTFIEAFGAQTDRPFIYVAVQYRLGLFGWGNGAGFAENGAGNLGLRDIKKSLEWVQQNIWAFGGNPDQVTVAGESAGAISIALLYLDEQINTFRSAIMQSGALSTQPLGPTATTWDDAYQYLLEVTNCTTSAPANRSDIVITNATQTPWGCLKSLPAEQLIQAQLKVKENPLYQAAVIFGPSIDGDLIPESPYNLLSQGKFAKIPFISGNNKDEGTAFVPEFVNSTELGIQFVNLAKPGEFNNDTVAQILELYPNDPALGSPFGTGNETFGLAPAHKQISAIFGDSQFQAPRRYFLQQANQHGLTDTWTYQFEQVPPGTPGYLGSYHASEIPYVFGIARPGLSLPFLSGGNYTAEDAQITDVINNYWLNFVYYTNPNGPSGQSSQNVTYWPNHDYAQNRNILRLKSDNVTLFEDTYRQEQMDFFNSRPKEFDYRRALASDA